MPAKRIDLTGKYIISVNNTRKSIHVYKTTRKNKNIGLALVKDELELGEHILSITAKNPKSFINIAAGVMLHAMHHGYIKELVKDDKAVELLHHFYRAALKAYAEHYTETH